MKLWLVNPHHNVSVGLDAMPDGTVSERQLHAAAASTCAKPDCTCRDETLLIERRQGGEAQTAAEINWNARPDSAERVHVCAL